MNKKDIFEINRTYLSKYRKAYRNPKHLFSPMTLTYSITAACQSRCKTCRIGECWLEDPSRSEKDLSLDEIEKVFKSMDPVYFFNISGGEPFLRKDIDEIIRLACKYLKPKVIHIPTNAILSQTIYDKTLDILEVIREYNPTTPLTIKPSIDGVGDLHDEIRGVKGNFEKLKKTIELLKEIEKKYSNFHLELGTVISNFNIDHLEEIENYVHSLGVESYRNEVAEQRTEFFNLEDDITPPGEVYQDLIKVFTKKIKKNIHKKRKLARTTEAMRVTYYKLASKILKKHKQVIPCYAGISNVHINYDGGVWPCCVLGYDKQMGNLRESNFDFKAIWYSDEAKQVRKYIKDRNCACPLANQAYSNILMHFPTFFKTGLRTILFSFK